MKKLSIILISILFSIPVFSQEANIVSLEKCIEASLSSHPLQNNFVKLSNSLSLQNDIISLSSRPSIDWNTNFRLQSESIGLDFDNPMIPSIEIPLYSAQTTLDSKYTIYDGGIKKARQALNNTVNALSQNQLEVEIDKQKKELLSFYFALLFNLEKDKVLNNSLSMVLDNIKRLQSGLQQGIVHKSDVQQIQVKAMELEAKIEANHKDKLALISVLSAMTGLELDNSTVFKKPEPEALLIDRSIDLKQLQSFELKEKQISDQKQLILAKKKPKAQAYLSAGLGYPNPLNFFDDNLGLYAVGGLGFSWNLYDWGKSKKEQQLLDVQKEIVNTQKEQFETQLNRYNERFQISIDKLNQQIQNENDIVEMKRSITEIQKSRLESGVIVPVEYLNSLNEIIDSELKLNQYKLEIIKVKYDYLLLKGKI